MSSALGIQADLTQQLTRCQTTLQQAGTPLSKDPLNLIALYIFVPEIRPDALIGRLESRKLPGEGYENLDDKSLTTDVRILMGTSYEPTHSFFFLFERITKIFQELIEFGNEHQVLGNVRAAILTTASTNFCLLVKPGNINRNPFVQYEPASNVLQPGALNPDGTLVSGDVLQGLPQDSRVMRFRLCSDVYLRNNDKKRFVGDYDLFLTISSLEPLLRDAGAPLTREDAEKAPGPVVLLSKESTHLLVPRTERIPYHACSLTPIKESVEPEVVQASCWEEENFCCSFVSHLVTYLGEMICGLFDWLCFCLCSICCRQDR